MAFALADRVKFTTATTGTGTITVSAAVAGYVTPAGSGQLADADVVPIFIEGAAGAWEHSLATLGSTQTTLTRVLRKSSTGSLLNLSGTSTVFIDPGAADLAMKVVASYTVSSPAATIIFTDLPQTYSALYMVCDQVSHNNGSATFLNFDLSINNGSSYAGTATYSSNPASTASVTNRALFTGYSKGVGLITGIYDTDAGAPTDPGISSATAFTFGTRHTGGANAIKFNWTAGSFDAGTITIYGIP
jgi:hypothetical protein